jgi:hypothetical protein
MSRKVENVVENGVVKRVGIMEREAAIGFSGAFDEAVKSIFLNVCTLENNLPWLILSLEK